MTHRFDVMTAREYETNGQTKTSFSRVGVAFPMKSGNGYTIRLEALPVDGKLLMMPQRPRDEQRGGGHREQSAPQGGGGYAERDYGTKEGGDDIPF